MTEWTLVEEKQPNDGDLVLICSYEAGVLKDSYFIGWFVDGEQFPRGSYKAKYWHPLPPAPGATSEKPESKLIIVARCPKCSGFIGAVTMALVLRNKDGTAAVDKFLDCGANLSVEEELGETEWCQCVVKDNREAVE